MVCALEVTVTTGVKQGVEFPPFGFGVGSYLVTLIFFESVPQSFVTETTTEFNSSIIKVKFINISF